MKSKNRQKISRRDFLKNIFASWYLFLFGVGMCVFFGFLIFSETVTVVKERIEITNKAPVYEVAEGTVESVNVHKYYTKRRAGTAPDLIPDRKYTAEISYTDESGIEHQVTSSEVDKRLSVGKRVKVAYHPSDEQDADIAYFDVLVWDYVPCYLNTFEWSDITAFIFFLLMVILFGELLCSLIKECAQKEYQKEFKKVLTKQQLRTRRNLYTLAGCAIVPICVIWHYGYLTGKEVILLSKLGVLMTGWPVVLKHIIIVFVCYLPVGILFGLRTFYEKRRLKVNNKEG